MGKKLNKETTIRGQTIPSDKTTERETIKKKRPNRRRKETTQRGTLQKRNYIIRRGNYMKNRLHKEITIQRRTIFGETAQGDIT